MVLYILVILVILILSKKIKRRRWVDHTCFVESGVLTKHECDTIIHIAKKYKFKTDLERVDGKPEYQIDILDEGIQNVELWDISKRIYDEKLKSILESEKWLASKKPNWSLYF